MDRALQMNQWVMSNRHEYKKYIRSSLAMVAFYEGYREGWFFRLTKERRTIGPYNSARIAMAVADARADRLEIV